MSKMEFNNEMVLMRPLVKKTRVAVVRNLIREMKKLREKHGDERKLAKFRRKADRLLDEIKTAKTVQDHEIPKFSITNTRTLLSILNDPTSDARTRAIAKFSEFPVLRQRINELKKKFPNHKELISSKKKTSKKKKEPQKFDSSSRNSNSKNKFPDMKMCVVRDKIGAEEMKSECDHNGKKKEYCSEESEEKADNEILQVLDRGEGVNTFKPQFHSEKGKEKKSQELELDTENEGCTSVISRQVSIRNVSSEDGNTKRPHEQKQVEKSFIDKRKPKLILKEIKTVSKEAKVKTLTEFLQKEEETDETRREGNKGEFPYSDDLQSKNNNDETEKEVDNFFITLSGDKKYESVVVPKIQMIKYDSDEFSNDYPQLNFKNRNSFKKLPNSEKSSRRFGSGRTDVKPSQSESKKERNHDFRNQEKFRSKFEKKTGVLSDEKLHPSWVAKKKQQEILKMGFQGKRITFDNL